MIITFIYKSKNDPNQKIYHGKYIGILNQPYSNEEGMDVELKNIIYEKSLKKQFNLNSGAESDIDNIIIGILGFNRDTNDYFSENEKDIFDLLYLNWSNQPIEIYFNGKLF